MNSQIPIDHGRQPEQTPTGPPYYPPNEHKDIYSSGDDRDLSHLAQSSSGPGTNHQGMSPFPHPFGAGQYPQNLPMFPSQYDNASMHVFNPQGVAGNFTQIQPSQKKRPKYTRSKAGCLTCRTKKIKCDEVKPVCTRCEHSARECTWPTDQPKKKINRRVRQSTSPEDAGIPSGSRTVSGSGSLRPGLPRPPRSASTHSSASQSSASEDTGSTLSGVYSEDSWMSGSESGEDGYRQTAMQQPGFPNDGVMFPPTTSSYGQLQNSMFNNYRFGQQGADMSHLTSGLPSLSVSSSSSPSPSLGSLSSNALYGSGNLPYALPQTGAVLNFDPLDPNAALPYVNPTLDPSVQWPADPLQSLIPGTIPANAYDGDYDDSDHLSVAGSNAPSLSVSSPNSLSPVSAPSPPYNAPPSVGTMASGQWSNTPIVTQGLDPIEPFFKSLRERNLIRHYSSYSTDLIIALRTHAVLNPILTTGLPITMSAEPRSLAHVEALRLSLLGVAAIHQAYLHSRSQTNRSYKTTGALTSPASQRFGSEPSGAYAESLRLGLLLRQNAAVCLSSALTTVDGSWHDAALAASISIALIDILAGGHGYRDNLIVAKTLVHMRGGPEAVIAGNPPQRTTFGGNILVSTPRILLETLAVYETFGSLTTGEAPTLLGHGHPDWWFTDDDWSYHQYSVEKVFAMSRLTLHLIAKTSSLLSRLTALGPEVHFTEHSPDPSASRAAVALHNEATNLLADLVEAERSELAALGRFSEVGADDERVAEEAGEANPGFKALAAQRIEHGSQSHMLAFQIVLLRQVFNVPRGDPRVLKMAENILQRCHDSAEAGMVVLLTWPVIIAGCEVSGKYRDMVPGIFEQFRKNCCFDIDTAEQLVNEVWNRVDDKLPGADWKSVLTEKDVKILLL